MVYGIDLFNFICFILLRGCLWVSQLKSGKFSGVLISRVCVYEECLSMLRKEEFWLQGPLYLSREHLASQAEM